MLDYAYRLGAARAAEELTKEANVFGLLSKGVQLGSRALQGGKGAGGAWKAMKGGVSSGWKKGYRSAFDPTKQVGAVRNSLGGKGLRSAGWLSGMSGKFHNVLGLPTGMALMGAATAEEGQRMQGAFSGAAAGLGAGLGMKAMSRGGKGAAKLLGKTVGKTQTAQKAWKGLGSVGKMGDKGLSSAQSSLKTVGAGALGVAGMGGGLYGFTKGEELGGELGKAVFPSVNPFRQAYKLPSPFNPVRGY